ncbi:molybdopterin converting factor subunit 1 [Bacillus shivajii]|uniref:molybdopterin converting factor subunit 1 n=1 Tax=Bacillus shivajii TaxID=1983719 RepID=UPI001CFAC1C8|nr:molybdopterin converting factor subunit 1 [Bacillus shivajii]UCZ51993.1 molybdopterin converting factor subunit 1 [Bacillus shivajii]
MIRILLFAELEEIVGQREITIEKSEMKIADIRNHLLENNEGLNGIKHAMAAVNEEFADNETTVKDGDVVAFIPPVSGG